MIRISHRFSFFAACFLTLVALGTPATLAQIVTYKPYIQPGDNGPFVPDAERATLDAKPFMDVSVTV